VFFPRSAIRPVQNVPTTTTTTAESSTTTTTIARAETVVLRGASTRVRPIVPWSRVASPGHQQSDATSSIVRRRGDWVARHGQDSIRPAARRAQLFRPSEIEL